MNWLKIDKALGESRFWQIIGFLLSIFWIYLIVYVL